MSSTYAIGFSGRTVAQVIELLQTHQVGFLVDVRSHPESDQDETFHPEPLHEALNAAGLQYMWMGDSLGGAPDDPSVQRDGFVDVELLRSAEFYLAGIARLEKAHQGGHRVALFSDETAPERSHRSRLIGVSLSERGIDVTHINEDGELRTQHDIEQRIATASESDPAEPDWYSQHAADPAADRPSFDGVLFGDGSPVSSDEYDDPDQGFQQPALDLADDVDAVGVLQQIFGYDEFRPLQAEAITNVVANQDTLVIMPTGGGKSLCYQIPALLLDGLTVVVSPLIALMEDQVTQLTGWGIPASYLNSSLDPRTKGIVKDQVRNGEIKLLYLAPETLLKPEILQLLQESRLELIAIDEAHCISSWGHDFRPEYRQLVEVRRRFPQATCIALTATATPQVQSDIRDQLAFSDANTFVGSFDRPNFYIDIQPKADVLTQSLAFVDAHKDESGIIYCGTRKDVDSMAARLQERGLKALPYHAGLSPQVRSANQAAFIRDEVDIMVATVAFGMGIDKPDVRYVLHIYLPNNIEGYYQQIGRAGRDGLPADVRLLFAPSDVGRQQRFIEQGAPSEAQQRQALLQALVGYVSSKRCRRRSLLEYFGQTYGQENCEGCDRCTQEQAPQVEITAAARQLLTCVEQTGGFFGAAHIIDVLRGSAAKKVIEKEHNRLSSYNSGRDTTKKEWAFFIHQFVDQGLIVRDAKYGSLSLTAEGRAIMNGEGKVMGDRLPPEQQASGRSGGTRKDWDAGDYDTELFGVLRAKRTELAAEANVPPYVIFGDRSLIEMATHFPQNEASFGAIHGVGATKIKKFASEFIPLIVTHCENNNLAEQPKSGGARAVETAAPQLTGSLHKKRWQDVGEAVAGGASIADVVTRFGVKEGTVMANLATFLEAGGQLSPEALQQESSLTVDDQQAVFDAFDQLGDEALRPIFDAFEGRHSYDELRLLRLVFRASH
jgi:ATP-dependent DNA helicase RecQ